MVVLLLTKKMVKKYIRSQCDRKICIKPNLHKRKGVYSRVRRKIKGVTLVPNIGDGSYKKTRHYLPNGSKKFVVYNVNELEPMMDNKIYCSEITHNVSHEKRKDFVERASQVAIVVIIYLIKLSSGAKKMNNSLNSIVKLNMCKKIL